jgi:hypothetical protein
MQFVLNQFPRNSKHVSRLPCEDAPIFLEEIEEREFLFGIQIAAYVSNLERFLRGKRNCLAKCVLRLDGRLGGLGLEHEWVWGGGDPAKACFNSCSSVDTVSLSAISQLSLLQSKARLMSPLMEMTPRGPGIFKTK